MFLTLSWKKNKHKVELFPPKTVGCSKSMCHHGELCLKGEELGLEQDCWTWTGGKGSGQGTDGLSALGNTATNRDLTGALT